MRQKLTWSKGHSDPDLSSVFYHLIIEALQIAQLLCVCVSFSRERKSGIIERKKKHIIRTLVDIQYLSNGPQWQDQASLGFFWPFIYQPYYNWSFLSFTKRQTFSSGFSRDPNFLVYILSWVDPIVFVLNIFPNLHLIQNPRIYPFQPWSFQPQTSQISTLDFSTSSLGSWKFMIEKSRVEKSRLKCPSS